MEKTLEHFDTRNDEKKKIEFSFVRKVVKPGEIWLCKIGINVGSEISKDGMFLRPILILKTGFGGDLVTAIPLTTKYNSQYSSQYKVFSEYSLYGVKELSYFVLNQLKIISIKRLIRKVNNVKIGGIDIPLLPVPFIKNLCLDIQKTLFP